MSGRGSGRVFRVDSNPTVTVGLTLSTSAPTLSATPKADSPFSILVTARIFETPHPNRPITLATHLNPLCSLSNRSFANIHCIYPPDDISSVPVDGERNKKFIKIFPDGWPHYIFDPNDLGAAWNFVTIPAPDSEAPYLQISHDLSWEKVREAELVAGEKYKVTLTDKGLGTKWWGFGDLEMDYKGVKFIQWRDEVEVLKDGSDDGQNRLTGEKPELFNMVLEGDGAVFSIV